MSNNSSSTLAAGASSIPSPAISADVLERIAVAAKDIVFHPGDSENRDEKLYRHDLSGNSRSKNFDQKVFMFPESYNQLRAELVTNFPELWKLVGWRMAYRAEEFIEYMNEALDMTIVFDTEKVDWICKQYLMELRKRRGASLN